MNPSATTIRYILIGIAVLFLGALSGWYFFLRSERQSIQTQDTARGYNAAAPMFENPTGSTYQNTAIALGLPDDYSASASSNAQWELWEVSNVPIAGFGWGSGATGNLYFAERSSGYVFEAAMTGRSVARLTDTLRPKTYEALFANDGSVVEQGIDANGSIETFAGVIATSTQPDASSTIDVLSGTELPGGIGAIAVDPVGKTLVYEIPAAAGVALVSTAWDGTKEKHLLSSPLQDWQITALPDGSIYLTQSPADNVEGYAYKLGQGGALIAVAQGPGLTILPRSSSSALLFGQSQGGALSLFAQMKASVTPLQLSIKTIPGKCVWTTQATSTDAFCAVPQSIPSQTFLDDWYKGLVHTSDQFWEVDASTGSTTLMYSPEDDAGGAIDVENPMIDPSGQYIAFMNATDHSLWVLKLSQ